MPPPAAPPAPSLPAPPAPPPAAPPTAPPRRGVGSPPSKQPWPPRMPPPPTRSLAGNGLSCTAAASGTWSISASRGPRPAAPTLTPTRRSADCIQSPGAAASSSLSARSARAGCSMVLSTPACSAAWMAAASVTRSTPSGHHGAIADRTAARLSLLRCAARSRRPTFGSRSRVANAPAVSPSWLRSASSAPAASRSSAHSAWSTPCAA
mmetsp:Transcript_26075/g.66123  ORF Transcript_26075/g.66123 Transcript_26075/m.66123 type:complete len:208 (+) Transcript_26075:504-1127(+)